MDDTSIVYKNLSYKLMFFVIHYLQRADVTTYNML